MKQAIELTIQKSINNFYGLSHGSDAYEIAKFITSNNSSPLVIIARDEKRMDLLSKQISFFSPHTDIITIPAWDCLPYDRISPSPQNSSNRVRSLYKLALMTQKNSFKNSIVITTINSCLQKIPNLEIIINNTIDIKVGQNLSRDNFVNNLINAGYLRSATANDAGEFSVRGSILDIIPAGIANGYRIDFFGDEVDNIRIFDPLTQISSDSVKHLLIVPTSEIILNKDTIALFRNNYRDRFNVLANNDPLYEAISDGRHYPGMEHWLPLFYEKTKTLFDYLKNFVVCFDYLANQARIERIETVKDYYQARLINLQNDKNCTYRPIPPDSMYIIHENEWSKLLTNHKQLNFSIFANDETCPNDGDVDNLLFHYRATNSILSQSKTKNINVFEYLKSYIEEKRSLLRKENSNTGLKCFIACFSNGSRDRLDTILKEHEFHTMYIDNWNEFSSVKGKTIGLIILELEQGFIGKNILIVSEQDILGERINTKRQLNKKTERFFIEASHLNEGELIVHKEHGIGRFEALETLNILGQKHDCLRIIYHGGDKFYLPVENIDAISRYGTEDDAIKLDKLGGTAWQERKAKLKKRICDIAYNLIKIAAERKLKIAPVMEAISGMYDEFCAGFPYVETEDQLRVINEITQDLLSGRAMDRLVCGDVGFGKTEVALRAAFIAAGAKLQKQVAIIAPTTLLARQHLKTFKERFAGFPFNVAGLSRLTPSNEAKKVRKGLEDGTIDIVVGTHALLAKSIKFKNLGLLIVDEEQLFGVTQKERLKELQSEIHVLSLSATPIPRTLQMSLSGIKDLSLITTPPIDRLAVRSYIMPFDDVVIRNAILREHYRGGKTFMVLPRIKDLDKMFEHLSKIVPEVSLIKAHGQMMPTILDDTMNKFYDGKYDVLISTNIIGSGLDLPTANTIIIHKADKFGLAQLYQMRGRVGRSKIRGYAYFTTDAHKQLSKMALKRLEIMQSLDSLGAGFSLASHDMDLRGFGNLLGDEQSGHVKEVGIELYQEMLEEAINNTKTSDKNILDDNYVAHINLNIPVFIPEEYVLDIELRLGLYRRIAAQKTEQKLEEIAIEMIDRFGKLPIEVNNLLEIMKIKLMAISAGIDKIDVGPKGVVLSFYKDNFTNPDNLIEYIHKNPTTVKLRGDNKLVVNHSVTNSEQSIVSVKNILTKIITLK